MPLEDLLRAVRYRSYETWYRNDGTVPGGLQSRNMVCEVYEFTDRGALPENAYVYLYSVAKITESQGSASSGRRSTVNEGS